jgi:hypothetical protein
MEYIAKGEPRDLGAAMALAENHYELMSKIHAGYDPLRMMTTIFP